MKLLKKIIFFSIFYFYLISISLSDTHNLQEILELIQSDIKTLEKAVYSENFKSKNENENFSNQTETEDRETTKRYSFAPRFLSSSTVGSKASSGKKVPNH